MFASSVRTRVYTPSIVYLSTTYIVRSIAPQIRACTDGRLLVLTIAPWIWHGLVVLSGLAVAIQFFSSRMQEQIGWDAGAMGVAYQMFDSGKNLSRRTSRDTRPGAGTGEEART